MITCASSISCPGLSSKEFPVAKGIGSTLEWLECSLCKAAFDVDEVHSLCDRCRGVLLPRYGLEEAARTFNRQAVREREPSMWRYRELLPWVGDPITLGEGMTPLLKAPFLGRSLGLDRLFIKDESQNPTGSFKARGMSTAVTMARDLGVRRLILPSAGNAGGAAAAYGALAGLSVDLYLPVETPDPFRLEAAALGATIHLVDGSIADCGARVRAEADGRFDISTLREPYRLEGKKTMGFELAEQFDWDLPEVVIYPTGGGTGLIGMWKAFDELERLDLIPSGQRPRMIAVQAERCAPIVKAFVEGRKRAEPWPLPVTYADGLRVPSAVGDYLILAAVRDSGGVALTVTDQEMADAQLAMARGEGIFPAPEGGATLAGLKKLVEQNMVDPGERIVLFNTGTGLKYPRVPGLKVP
ncbi:MAG: threonine synthase [Acidobacteria bacterium]|uniref:Threonine synthase n=1 Tax=Candidatus Polarisedimenticola svalbardensis TaxID=2886004 RepID=A0A8J6XTM2_9BACT|nr:threonine synthase [Candidatus Polarisedimenticola svalbardensis]